MPEIGGRLQPIRKFTAQIRKPSGYIVGTAFAVDFREGLLVTCRHVVEAVSKPCEVGTVVYVYFPLISGEPEEKLFPAKVERMFEDHDDDVVVLKLDADTLPPGVEVAIVGGAEASTNCEPAHTFRSFGFRKLEKYQGLPAYGTIIDFTLKPEGTRMHCEPLMLESQHIDAGMSGAAVLDMARNVVVGVITETWYAGKVAQDEHTGFAVDGAAVRLLSEDVRFHVEDRLPFGYDQPPTEQAQERAAANVVTFPLPPAYHPAQPPTLDEWVGREALLDHLDADYANPAVHVTSLIGFGGEGKSSVAYRWVTRILESDPPEALFWWNFYDNRSFEAMVERAASYLYSDVAQTWQSTAGRVEAIGALLRERRIVLVLDGFEVMQEDEGDRYGTVSNKDVLRLLELCAQGEHNSFCLVTSRAPLLDLLSHTAHVQREVTRLELADGVQLLRNVGLTGTDAALQTIVTDWDGHALTVSLTGAYLRDTLEGDAGRYSKEMFPELDGYAETEERYKGVSRILRRYDAHLDEAERAFLKLFSVFRLPVPESAFERVFRTETGPDSINAPLVGLDDDAFDALVLGLVKRRLIRRGASAFTTHPLVRNHYLRLLEGESQAAQTAAHTAVAEHYQASSEPPGEFPTLDDLQPYIEVVHHLCRAGAYDEARQVHRERIDQGNRAVLINQLGAYETMLTLMLEFFPDRDSTGEPQTSNPAANRFILNAVGFGLMSLGRLAASAPCYERATQAVAEAGDHHNACRGYINLAEVYTHTGQLTQAADSAELALAQARQVADERKRQQDEIACLAFAAWIAHLRGDLGHARGLFQQAEALNKELHDDSSVEYLYSRQGVFHADHLRLAGQADYARRVTDANLKGWVADYGWKQDEVQCHRVLGDLDADAAARGAGAHGAARAHYEHALTIARGIDRRDVLIEALIAYGRWQALHGGEPDAGRGLLEEALGYCTEGGYVLYEADARIALAQVAQRAGDRVTASNEAAQALAIGARTGYHWARVDAQAVLDALAE
jgi:tetratricopeptide (TPR) repeat protein